MTLLEKAGLSQPIEPRDVMVAAHRTHAHALSSPHLGTHRGARARVRLEAWAASDVWCWDRARGGDVVRCRLADLFALEAASELHPEGEIDAVHVEGAFVVEIHHAEHETVYELRELDPVRDSE